MDRNKPESPISLRPAVPEDEGRIKHMVRQANINPMDLAWQRFVLAVAPQGEIIGCGQIKSHRDGTSELASIVVEPAWRGQGIARKLIEHLIASHNGTLYLTCRAHLESFYNRFGFTSLPPGELTPYFRRLYRLVNGLQVFGLAQEGLRVMRREAP